MMSDKLYMFAVHMKITIAIAFILLSFENVFAQPLKVESKYLGIDSILFDLRNEKIKKNKQYHFFRDDSVLVGGFNLKKKADNNKVQLVWEKKFIFPLIYKQDSTYIECILYKEDVENLFLCIQPSDTSQWYSYKLPFSMNYNGYQQPYDINLSDFNIPGNNNKIKAIRLVGETKSGNAKVIIGYLRLFTTNLKVNQYVHPIFGYSLSDMVNNNSENSLKNFVIKPIILSHSAIYNPPGYQLN